MVYIIAFALILRLILINQSLWLDEAIQALALMGKMGPLMTYALADFQPPLYHFIGWIITSVAGYSEVALRTPSLLAGVATVYYTSRLGELLGGKKVMYIAGLITATNPLLIYYSQEGRTYGLTTFFVTAAMYYFYRSIKSPNTFNLILYTLYSILFLWTSYLSWFLHFALFIYTLFLRRRDLLVSQIFSAITLLLWLPSLISSLGIGISTISSSPAWGSVVGGISFKALALTWVKANIGRISIENDFLYGSLIILILTLHIFVLSKIKFKLYLSNINYLLLSAWISAVPLAAVASLILPVYSYTRIMFVVPAYLLLLTLALSFTRLRYAALIISLQLLALGYFWVNQDFHREAWREVVQEYGKDIVYALPSRAQNAPLLYYGVPRSQIIEPKTNVEAKSSSIIYIKYAEEIFDSSYVGEQNLKAAGYTLASQKVYPGLQVDIYENNN